MLYNRSAIELAPLQVYSSGLVFAPAESIVKNQFKEQASQWTRRFTTMESHWSAVLQTFESHLASVNAVAFSPYGKVVASGSYDGAVKLCDAGTGEVLQTLKGHLYSVNAVAFSPDGKVVASGSHDWTVKL